MKHYDVLTLKLSGQILTTVYRPYNLIKVTNEKKISQTKRVAPQYFRATLKERAPDG